MQTPPFTTCAPSAIGPAPATTSSGIGRRPQARFGRAVSVGIEAAIVAPGFVASLGPFNASAFSTKTGPGSGSPFAPSGAGSCRRFVPTLADRPLPHQREKARAAIRVIAASETPHLLLGCKSAGKHRSEARSRSLIKDQGISGSRPAAGSRAAWPKITVPHKTGNFRFPAGRFRSSLMPPALIPAPRTRIRQNPEACGPDHRCLDRRSAPWASQGKICARYSGQIWPQAAPPMLNTMSVDGSVNLT